MIAVSIDGPIFPGNTPTEHYHELLTQGDSADYIRSIIPASVGLRHAGPSFPVELGFLFYGQNLLPHRWLQPLSRPGCQVPIQDL